MNLKAHVNDPRLCLMKLFDIKPFALPNCKEGEIRFEEPRDIMRVVIKFANALPRRIGLSFLKKKWPQIRVEKRDDMNAPFRFGWVGTDDWFNCEWQKASVSVKREPQNNAIITFQGLITEFPEMQDYNVTFRRTIGIRLDVPDLSRIQAVSIYTTSSPVQTRLRVQLNAGHQTKERTICIDCYNAKLRSLTPVAGVSLKDKVLHIKKTANPCFELELIHMLGAHKYSGDDGHVRFITEKDSFTISLASLEAQGPIWFADKGFFITKADTHTTFAEYRAGLCKEKTIARMVKAHSEQTYAGAFNGQPRPHATAYSLGWKYNRQRFWLDANGDLILMKMAVKLIPGPDTNLYANKGNGRFFFGLENWSILGRCPDSAPTLAYNIRFRKAGLQLEQKSFAFPLERSTPEVQLTGAETIICMLRFLFTNTGLTPVIAKVPIRYSQNSNRSPNPYMQDPAVCSDWLVPKSEMEKLYVKGNSVYGTWKRHRVLRCTVDSSMKLQEHGKGAVISKLLHPGEICEAVLKIPFIHLDSQHELQMLKNLNFDQCYEKMARFWQKELKKGAQVQTPVPQLTDLHASHLTHVQITDSAMPQEPRLINTSVGTSTYGNFSNESCMINQELDQRGLLEDARRRLEIWVKFQGTAQQPGNFTDYKGMYYGAGGFECGAYNQHHGWVLWRISQHFLYSRDKKWFKKVVDSVIAGADWVFRQRRNTMNRLPHSRGWEHGFLPAGSLEDVTDFYYWLSTNSLTWRGVDTAAVALELYKHPQAKRIRREANAYAHDLRRGFEIMRQHSPLVRLRNGQWIPHYPSRLYCRGRSIGWIREILEGSIYLLLSGLYSSNSKEADWILNDYQDSRYMSPPYGYPIVDWEHEWFDRGGFSCQPNLLAGLLPYLDRDEPELYIWMFFNAWCACYREEIGAMVEHPSPVLGYSNTAHFKTSDQANAIMWLRYMFIYATDNTLFFGRAIPRKWFASEEEIGATNVTTFFGTAGITYKPSTNGKSIQAFVSLNLQSRPSRILVRFRHPEKKPIKSVKIDGRQYKKFNPHTGDVDITEYDRLVKIVACYD